MSLTCNRLVGTYCIIDQLDWFGLLSLQSHTYCIWCLHSAVISMGRQIESHSTSGFGEEAQRLLNTEYSTTTGEIPWDLRGLYLFFFSFQGHPSIGLQKEILLQTYGIVVFHWGKWLRIWDCFYTGERGADLRFSIECKRQKVCII